MYSDDYWQARETFRKLAANQGATRTSLLPYPDVDLTIDCAWIGNKNANNLIIHIAGVHGVEGFVGSAIQTDILSRELSLPADTACLFIHPLNPFGMAYLRRANGNNVDLNRNALMPGEDYAGEPEHFDIVRSLCSPKTMNPNSVVFAAKTLKALLTHGFSSLRQAVAGGQYNHPKDIYFGGNELQPELLLLFQYLESACGNVERLAVIDIHSGLGKFSEDMLIGSSTIGVDDELEKLLGKPLITAGAETAKDLYSVRGEILNRFVHCVQPNLYLAFIQEFGTYHGVKVFEALARENYWWWQEDATLAADRRAVSPALKLAGQKLRDVFVPLSQSWRRNVVDQGTLVFKKVLGMLGTTSI
jgi:hypothetical protein